MFQAGNATDGRKDTTTGVRLAEETDATGCLCLRTHFGIVVRRDEDYRGDILDGGESLSQLQSGYPFELDIEHQTIKLRVLRVGKELFGGRICDRLKVCGPQQSAQRTANALVIVDHRNVNVLALHRI